jgi:pimeloyl-ACP methyl ester carboxylesterase
MKPQITSVYTNTSPEIELLAYQNSQNSANQPLLFIHAVAMGAYAYESHFLPFFEINGYRTYAMNWRGHGNSTASESLKSHSFLDYFQDIENAVAYIENQTGKKPILVGHSTGGLLVQHYLSKNIASLAVIIGVGDAQKSVGSLVDFLSINYPEKVQQFFATGDSDVLMKDAGVHTNLMFTKENQPENFLEIANKMASQGTSDRLFVDFQTLKTPTPLGKPKVFIISGDTDPIGTIESVKTLATFYKGNYHVVSNHKHDLLLSKGWEETASEILKFIQLN